MNLPIRAKRTALRRTIRLFVAPDNSLVVIKGANSRMSATRLFGSRGPQASLWEVGKTKHGRHSDAYAVNRRGK